MRSLLQQVPAIPVLVIEDVAHAVPLAQALVAGGLKVLEVTLRTPAALASIRALRDAVPEAVVGAGTVLNADQYAAAVEAGSQFVVSPGCSPALLAASRRHGVPLLPGATTPTEIIAALDAGIDTLKFFPAAQSGGVAMLQALSSPLPQVAFCPTGGITMANAAEYLALPNVLCVGMSSLVTKEWLAQGNYSAIYAAAVAAAALRARG
jgi:2-dehydro-3-deoxyphosphogluconate aldolase / (4S)-4-hydroxy-2-oxoglutarate aldolase